MRFTITTTVALVATLLLFAVSSSASHTPPPASVTLAGSLQSEIGCAGDWDPGCVASHLDYDAADGVWQKAFSLPAGDFEYKAALNASWDENYGLHAGSNGANIPLHLAASATVKFYYDHATHWITDNKSSVIATVPGQLPVGARVPRRLAARLPALVAGGSRRRRHLQLRDDRASGRELRGEGRDQRGLGRELRRGRRPGRSEHSLHGRGEQPEGHLLVRLDDPRALDPRRPRARRQRRVGRLAARLARPALPDARRRRAGRDERACCGSARSTTT